MSLNREELLNIIQTELCPCWFLHHMFLIDKLIHWLLTDATCLCSRIIHLLCL